MINNKRSFYEALAKKGYYLPSFKDRAITGEWLWNVFNGNAYCPKREKIKIGHLPEKVTAIDLFQALEE